MSNKKKKELKLTFSTFYQNYKDSIYRMCSNMVYDKSLTDDLFQEVMLKIWKGLKNFRSESKVSTWAYRIVNNTSINFNLKHQRNKDKIEKFKDLQQNKRGENNQKELLYDLIERLQSADRMIVGLYLEGYSYKEISNIIGITTTHVGVRINRIKSYLNTIYNKK